MASKASYYYFISSLLLVFLATQVSGECTCDAADVTGDPKKETLKYKIGSIVVILVSSAIGVSLPILGKRHPALRPESNFFFLIKAFAAGVILSTGFIHILPDAFDDLTNPCLNQDTWGSYPFTGLATMLGSIGTLMIDAYATSYFRKAHSGKQGATGGSQQVSLGDHEDGHGHGHGHGAGLVVPEGYASFNLH